MQAELRDTVESCKPLKATFPKGFLTREDVNGDGVADFILDYSGVACGNDAPLNCGSHGCSIEVYVSRPNGGFAKVFDIIAFGVTFRQVKGRPALVLTAVGCAPATTCVALWNGREFKLSRRRR